MRLFKSSLLLGLLLLLTASFAHAQPRSFRYWSIGVGAGTMHYQGDLDDHGFEPWIGLTGDNQQWGSPLRLLRPSFSANAIYHFHPHMNLQFGFCYGWIGAADSLARNTGANRYRNFRNLDFRNRIFEASAILNYDFFTTDRHYRFRPGFTPYVFAGLAVFAHNPFTFIRDYEIDYYSQANGFNLEQFRDERIFLQPLNNEGQTSGAPNTQDAYSLVNFSIPMGVGLKFKLADRLDLRVFAGLRKTFTDHLDDVGSYYYADPDAFLNGTLPSENGQLSYILSDRSRYRSVLGGATTAYDVQQVDLSRGRVINEEQGEKRGFPNQTDWYAYSGVSINWIIDPGDRCPKFR